MVRQHSTGTDAENDGMLGLLREDEFQRIFNARRNDTEDVFALSEGGVTDVIYADGAYHVFKILSKRPDIPFETVNTVRTRKRSGN